MGKPMKFKVGDHVTHKYIPLEGIVYSVEKSSWSGRTIYYLGVEDGSWYEEDLELLNVEPFEGEFTYEI